MLDYYRFAQSVLRGMALLMAFLALYTMQTGVNAAQQAKGQAVKPKLPKAIRNLPRNQDASPLPNYKGQFISMGLAGNWYQAPGDTQKFLLSDAAGQNKAAPEEPEANCSAEAIIHYARYAPSRFEIEKSGLLYNVKTHIPATAAYNRPGFNSCALVVYAILKQAGCKWAKYTASAKALYDNAYDAGWRPSKTQKGGCIVAWNSHWDGWRRRIGETQGHTRAGGTLFRHLGITTGSWLSVDNTSYLSRPGTFITTRPFRYEAPIFLCAPENADLPEKKRRKSEKKSK